MRRGIILLVAGALLVTPGCLDQDFGDLIGSTDREMETLHSFTESFSYTAILDPMDPPGDAEDAYQRGSTAFDVPEDARDLTVHYTVTFRSSGEQSPPQELQEARLTLEGISSGENESVTIATSTEGSWTIPEPSPGSWTFTYEVRGEGSLILLAFAMVPTSR